MNNLQPAARCADRTQLLFRQSFLLLVLLGFMGLLLTGCGDGRPARVKVSGFVTIDGEPLKYGGVNFRPAGGGRAAGGRLDENGQFTVTMYEKGDGLPPGNYIVAIKATQWVSESSERWHAPMKYAYHESSELTAEISEETSDLTFELTWKGDRRKKPWVEKD